MPPCHTDDIYALLAVGIAVVGFIIGWGMAMLCEPK